MEGIARQPRLWLPTPIHTIHDVQLKKTISKSSSVLLGGRISYETIAI